MRDRRAAPLLPPILAALAIVALTLYAYRELPARPFAADDYQWLLSVRGLSFGEVARRAFDPAAQSHFYRPLIWLLFWAQTRLFGLDPRGFHAVSLGLHLLNAALLGGLLYRLQIVYCSVQAGPSEFAIYNMQSAIPLLVTAIVALHPAPFEAVVWVSSQSELLAATLLLVALHLWLDRRPTTDDRRTSRWSFLLGHSSLLATLALALALLAKESAVIGLPLLMLIGAQPRTAELQNRRTTEAENHASGDKQPRRQAGKTQAGSFSILNFQFSILNFVPYILPTLVTLGYIALQVAIERRNYLLAQGGYGIGPQLLLNPLRSLALIVAPLPVSEHADAAWLVPVGAIVALSLLAWLFLNLFRIAKRRGQSRILQLQTALIVALGLTLLPTAPFTSPPDSRYLYLPVMAAALLARVMSNELRVTSSHKRAWPLVTRHSSLVTGIVVLALAWWSSGELHAREGRFAAASGPGGSLWRVAQTVCAESSPDRMVIVDPPLAPPHAEAIVGLACGEATRAKIVGRDQVAKAIKGHTVVIGFPNGSATIEQQT